MTLYKKNSDPILFTEELDEDFSVEIFKSQ